MIPATLVLDAEMTAKDVRQRLMPSAVIAGIEGAAKPERLARHDDAPVVIRRRHQGDILLYVRTVAEIRAALEHAKPTDTVAEFLELHEYQRAKTRELRTIRAKGAGRFTGVVLDGERIAGVVQKVARPRQQAAAPASDRGVRYPVDEGPTRTGERGGTAAAGPPEGGGMRGGGMRGGMRGGSMESRAGARGGGGGFRGSTRGGGETSGSEPRTRSGGPRASRPNGGVRAANGGDRPKTTPQSAFPLVKAPDVVRSGEEFDVTVGLSKVPVKGVTADAMTIQVPVDEDTITLDVQVSADVGFKAPKGWRHTLTLEASNIYKARIEIPLVAPEVAGESLFSVLSVHFSHDGVHLGTATRRIEVAKTIAKKRSASPWVRAATRPAAMTMDLNERAPDLTIRIEKPDADEATGQFVWTFESPHAIKLPSKPLPMNLGSDAKTFAKALIALIDENYGKQLLAATMRGIGSKITQKIPADVWRILRDVAAAVAPARGGTNGRPLTVLLYSAETSVPWELAVMPQPLDTTKPPYLGAQVALGRWILGTNGPSVPPARAVDVEKMAVVTGYYKKGSKLSRLPGAEQESAQLVQAHGGIALDATPENVRQLLEGTMQGADDIHAIHFACHGEVQPASPELNALFLSDGSPLNEFVFQGAQIGERTKPILFLNACQVGTQGEMLGESAGFGAGCLYAGFRAFVAPLWSIDDAAAREVALDFYRTAFDTRQRTFVSSFFQNTRCKFVPQSATDVPQSTYLAYVFFGHPELLLST